MSEIEYEVQTAMSHVDEAKADEQTAQMINSVNIATAVRRREEEKAAIASRLGSELQKRRNHGRRKWRAVLKVGKVLVAAAAMYGFQCLLGLPAGLIVAGMVLLLALAAKVLATELVPEVLWYLRHKAVMGR